MTMFARKKWTSGDFRRVRSVISAWGETKRTYWMSDGSLIVCADADFHCDHTGTFKSGLCGSGHCRDCGELVWK